MSEFALIPSTASPKPKPFEIHIPEEQVKAFKQLLELSPIGPTTFENKQQDNRFGITQTWLKDAKEHWLNGFDWRQCERHMNSFPNFKTPVTDDDGTEFEVHFIALFSKRADAIPVILLHGWPGSFLEFLPMLAIMKEKYTSATLPYHLVVPSLLGYAFSSSPPLGKTFTTRDNARIMDKLMSSLGFGGGYVAQGGDIGSGVTRILATTYDSCKAAHVNMCPADLSKLAEVQVDDEEMAAVKRRSNWSEFGTAYAKTHGTRPSTIGLVLSSSPLALLGWIGEKFLEWSDDNPSLDVILESVSLYWFTGTFPRSIYFYRERWGPQEDNSPAEKARRQLWGSYISKPFGFSWFPQELFPTPKALAAQTGNLVWHRRHEKGGHFAALERPEEFTQDIEDFVATAWPMAK